MEKLAKIMAAIIVILGGYSLITDNYNMVSYIQMLFGIMILIYGLREFVEKQNKIRGIIFLVVGGLILYTGIIIVQGQLN